MFEENQEKNHERNHHHMGMHKRNWMRHTAMVPKGFIRYHVLNALSEKPMSGSELMGQIEQRSVSGFWKPSPGSIYPLLAYLQDSSYIKELPTENGMKRYELTENGKLLLKEQKTIMKKFRETMGFPQPPFGTFFMKLPPEKTARIRDTMKRVGTAMYQLVSTMQENFSEQALEEAIKAIDETAEKLEEITKKIKEKGEKHE
jgi:DNA-binding PadR family transcriptional regulator